MFNIQKEKEVTNKKNLRWLRFSVTVFFIFLFILSVFYIFFEETYKNKTYPGVFIGELNLGQKTKEEIKEVYDKWSDKLKMSYVVNENGRGIISPNINNAIPAIIVVILESRIVPQAFS